MAAETDVDNWTVKDFFRRDGILYHGPPCTPESVDKVVRGDVPEIDVLVATYPRSGTARLLEICWRLTHGCDLDKADKLPGISDSKMNTAIGNFPGDWHQFMTLSKTKDIPYGDYFDNVLSWWTERHRANVMIVRYEDMNEKPFDVIKEISEFLGQDHTDEKLQALADWSSFSNMRTQKSTNYEEYSLASVFKKDISPYMRKGTVGDWKNYFSEEESDYIDEICQSRCKPEGLTFKFD